MIDPAILAAKVNIDVRAQLGDLYITLIEWRARAELAEARVIELELQIERCDVENTRRTA